MTWPPATLDARDDTSPATPDAHAQDHTDERDAINLIAGRVDDNTTVVTVGLTKGQFKVSDYSSGETAIQAASDALGSHGGKIVLLDLIECHDALHDVGGGTQFAAVELGDYVDLEAYGNAGIAWADGASASFTHQGAGQNYLLAPGTFSRVNCKVWGRGNYTCTIGGVATLTASGTNTLGSGVIVTRRRMNFDDLHIEGFAEHGFVSNNNDTPAVSALGFQAGKLRIKACGGTGFLAHAWSTDCEIDQLWVGACNRNVDILTPELRIGILHSWGSAEWSLVFDGVNGSNQAIAEAYVESNAKAIYLNQSKYVKIGLLELRANGLDSASQIIKCQDAAYNTIVKGLALNNIGPQVILLGHSHHNDFNIDFRDEYAADATSSPPATISHPVSMTAGDAHVTFTSDAPLDPGSTRAPSKHVGCWLVVPGAGAAGATITSARIASVQDASHCILDTQGSTTVTNAAAVLHALYAHVWEGTSASSLDTNATPNTYRGSSHLTECVNSQVAINSLSSVVGMLGVGTATPTKVIAASGSALAISWRDGFDVADVKLDHTTVTVSFFNATPTLIGREIMLILRQDATGSRTVTWPSNVKFAGGTLTLTTTANAVDAIRLRYDGTNWVELSRSLNIH